MAYVEFLEDDIGRVISSPMMAVEINERNISTHLLFSVWKYQPLYLMCRRTEMSATPKLGT